MAKTTRLVKSFYRLLLPVALLLLIAVGGGAFGILYKTSQPQKFAYLVTPEKYGRLSASGARVTDETWTNGVGTTARGWLLRGEAGAPAVVLLHRYGADRSYVLNLGVKINEATGFTILMPDQRGHGANPPVKYTSFGGCETSDAASAIEFLRGLKGSDNQANLVGQNVGIYGVDLGALAALEAAAKDENIKAVALDSVPENSDAVLASAVDKKFPFASALTSRLAAVGARAYFYNGCYRNDAPCDAAKQTANRQVLLLAGADAPALQSSTEKLSRCFPASAKVETKLDLNPSGYGIQNASLEQSEAYDQRVIAFFKQALL